MSENETAKTDVTPDEPNPSTAQDEAKAEHKRARHRKKQLFERILKQMEFYLSDANLTKDRYLGELTRKDPCVPLDVFLKFNKIRSLTDNVADIAKAIQGSQVVECVDNDKVRRKFPLEPYDAESRTVYVEAVPAMVSRDWLEKVFSEYGHVAYISLPKFKNTNKNKGFAFIEYKTPEEAQKCLAAFTKIGCKLPTSMSPDELTTIKTFSAEHSTDDSSQKNDQIAKKGDASENNNQQARSESDSDKTKNEPQKIKTRKDSRARKRKHKQNEDSKKENSKNENEPAVKRAKLDSESETEKCEDTKTKQKEDIAEIKDDSVKCTAKNTNNHERKRTKEKKKVDSEAAKKENKNEKKGTNENSTNASTEIEDTEKQTDTEKEETGASSQEETKPDEPPKKRSRKRTAKERTKAKNKKSKCGLPEGAARGLQVLSKAEWRALRNKYLNLQRRQMKELKSSLRAQGLCRQPAVQHRPAQSEEARAAEAAGATSKLLRTEGVFVKVALPEPCTDVRATKRQVRSNVHVQHVSVCEGGTDMVVRFDTPESAQQYCASGVYESARVLLGAESEAEWGRAEAERAGAGGGARRPRGRDRLLRRAAAVTEALQPAPTHLRFED